MFKIIFCIAAYIVLMFVFFFVANLIYDMETDDDKSTLVFMSVFWPVSTAAWIFFVLFRCVYELARDLKKTRARRRKGDSE